MVAVSADMLNDIRRLNVQVHLYKYDELDCKSSVDYCCEFLQAIILNYLISSLL